MKTLIAVTLAMILVLSLCGSCFASDYGITSPPVEKYENKTIDEDDVEDITEELEETISEMDSDDNMSVFVRILNDGSRLERVNATYYEADGTIRRTETGTRTYLDGTVTTEVVTFAEDSLGNGIGRGILNNAEGTQIAEVFVRLTVLEDGTLIRVTTTSYFDGRVEQRTEIIGPDASTSKLLRSKTPTRCRSICRQCISSRRPTDASWLPPIAILRNREVI